MMQTMWTTPFHPLPSSATSSATPSAQFTHKSSYSLHLPPFCTLHFPAHVTSIKIASQHWICDTHALRRSFWQQQPSHKTRKDINGSVTATVATETNCQRSTPLGLEIVESREANSRVVLSIVVPPNVCKDSYDQVLIDFSKRIKVPGFRPGKRVPESILVNFIGQKQVRASAIEAVLKKTLPEAMAAVAGRALKDTEHIVTEFDHLQATFSPSSSLRYDIAVDVAPDVGWITDNAYKNLNIEVDFDDDKSTLERAANAELQTRYKDLGSLRIVTDRGVQIGDVVILDITAKRITEDEEEGDNILSAEQKGFQLDTEEGSKLLPGFVDALLGLEKGQRRTFDLIFPSTWEQEALRGVKARFTADCKELFLRILPELDDSIAASLHENCNSLDQVKKTLLEKHKIIVEKAKNDATKAAIIKQLPKVVVVDVPNSLLEEQGRQMYAMSLIELQANMSLSKEQMISLSSQEMVYNFLQSKRAQITDAVKQSLAVAEIFKLEKLQYTEEELNTEIQNAIAEFKKYGQEFDEGRVREQACELLEGSKVLDWLVEHSDLKYVKKNAMADVAGK